VRKGVTHHYTIEQLRAFRDTPAIDKLRWLESMRRFLEKSLTPERIEIMQRFRRGEL
jgi:hypothetical protein